MQEKSNVTARSLLECMYANLNLIYIYLRSAYVFYHMDSSRKNTTGGNVLMPVDDFKNQVGFGPDFFPDFLASCHVTLK
jgi:hypothetical protein